MGKHTPASAATQPPSFTTLPPRLPCACEADIGSWLKARGARDDVIIATKATGPGLAHIRDGSRLTRFEQFQRYSTPLADEATRAYVEIARRHELDPARMALAFVNSRPFLTSNIIGATTMDQLESDLASESLRLSDEVLEAIEDVHRRYPTPCP